MQINYDELVISWSMEEDKCKEYALNLIPFIEGFFNELRGKISNKTIYKHSKSISLFGYIFIENLIIFEDVNDNFTERLLQFTQSGYEDDLISKHIERMSPNEHKEFKYTCRQFYKYLNSHLNIN